MIATGLASALIAAISLAYTTSRTTVAPQQATAQDLRVDFEEAVAPEAGARLPIAWGSIGKQLVSAGVIDRAKFEAIYAGTGGLNAEEKKILYGTDNGNLVINRKNAGFLLNMLWAFGLWNKNAVLEHGPMMDPKYGGAGNFASTGGWTIAEGDAMQYYSKYALVKLNPAQQEMVERVSKNIYRPCCDNATYFPDCNHGMAMLGLLELMARQNISENEMYKTALSVNAYWFPDTYATIAHYFTQSGTEWKNIDPKQALGADFSSASGFQKIAAEIEPSGNNGGGSCGV